MRILHLLTTNKISGAETVCINIINHCKNEYECIYCSPIGEIKKSLKNDDILFYPLNNFTLKEVKRAIKKTNPDIIHAHDIRATVYAALSSKGIPIISHIHGRFQDMCQLSVRSLIYKIITKKIYKIICVSKSIYNNFYFQNDIKAKGILLENKIDLDNILQRINSITNAPEYDFSFIGRLENVKNPKRFIYLIKQIQMKNKSIKACMVGDGSLFNECKEIIDSEDINIDLLGFQNEPLYYLKNTKALIMTSISEGIPMAALESLACNKPVLSTPTDGLLDIIINDKNGFICDSDIEFLEKMEYIISNHNGYDNMCRFIKSNNKNQYIDYIDKIKQIYKCSLRV